MSVMLGYNRFAKALRRLYQFIHPGWHVDAENVPQEPVVFVVHHQNMFGPVHALGLLPRETMMWSLYVFREPTLCFEHYYNYTFRQRYGWPKPLAYVVCKPLSHIVSYTLRSFDVIPVYHDARAMRTIRLSLEALEEQRSLTICPDIDYASDSAALGEVYTGFLLLGRQYYRKTGRPLQYVPAYVSRGTRSIVFGEALSMDTEKEPADAIAEMAATLTARMNALGTACGDIKA